MSTKVVVRLAETAGFCWGVKRALDIVLDAAEKNKSSKELFTYGPLIHNPQVITMLEAKNVHVLNSIDGRDPAQIVIRTHGTTPMERKKLKDAGWGISDATCPLVARVQGIIKKYLKQGYHIAIIGDAGHAEVKGLMGYAGEYGMVLESEKDFGKIEGVSRVCILAQTTCDTEKFKKYCAEIEKIVPETVVVNTICEATEDRQSEIHRLAREVEMMIVVGGRNSANTARLANIATEEGANTLWIETEAELTPEKLAGMKSIGVTAGASTPSWLIQQVLDRINLILESQSEREETAFSWVRKIPDFLVNSRIYLALGAAAISYAAMSLAEMPIDPAPIATSFLYIFSLYTLYPFFSVENLNVHRPEKKVFFDRHRNLLIALGLLSAATGLLITALIGWVAFLIYTSSAAIGLLYSARLFTKSRRFPYERLQDIPASKTVMVSVAWGIITVILPFITAIEIPETGHFVFVLAFVFLTVFIRTLAMDVKDVEADRIVGRETIPVIIGLDNTKPLIGLLSLISASVVIAGSLFGILPAGAKYLALVPMYGVFFSYMYFSGKINRKSVFETSMDGKFILAAIICAYLSW